MENDYSKAVNKYMSKTYQRVVFIVRKKDEQDILDHLAKQPSKNKYIKGLIRKDMEKSK